MFPVSFVFVSKMFHIYLSLILFISLKDRFPFYPFLYQDYEIKGTWFFLIYLPIISNRLHIVQMFALDSFSEDISSSFGRITLPFMVMIP